MQPPGLRIDEILTHPEDWTFGGLLLPLPRPQGEAERKTGRGSEIGDLGSVDLMQRRSCEAAVQDLVQPGHAETDPPGRNRAAPQGGLSEAAA